jgi:hypothetical protein
VTENGSNLDIRTGLEPCDGTTDAWYTGKNENSKLEEAETLFTKIVMLVLKIGSEDLQKAGVLIKMEVELITFKIVAETPPKFADVTL